MSASYAGNVIYAHCKFVISLVKVHSTKYVKYQIIPHKKSTSYLFCCRMWQAVNFPFAILTRGQSAEFHEPWI